MNTLKRKPGRPPNNPPSQNAAAPTNRDAEILETMRRLDGDAAAQLGPVFADEMADPDSAKTLKAAFHLGVRFGANQFPVLLPNIAADAAARLVGQYIADQKQIAAGVATPST